MLHTNCSSEEEFLALFEALAPDFGCDELLVDKLIGAIVYVFYFSVTVL